MEGSSPTEWWEGKVFREGRQGRDEGEGGQAESPQSPVSACLPASGPHHHEHTTRSNQRSPSSFRQRLSYMSMHAGVHVFAHRAEDIKKQCSMA